MGYYKTAQICENGHVITASHSFSSDLHQDYCDKCGAKTITACPSCNANIHGKYEVEGVFDLSSTQLPTPSFCYNCGAAYPWTKSALEATQELLALESNLSPDELTYLNENMASILVDTPKTKVVATKFKIALGKIGLTTASAVKDILVDVASEAAKKIIFPQ
ncbi:DUF2321 domain-containing protein [Clostridium beijerinckii]|uniref:DUF2321 domain-containing protein n=1 Tax=Clostridium beijerinckii TaxID=1520 RepID=UPI0022271812|nr:DUF2321 domain-containing protein [Clostridium beijerinckii]UYZ36765.1 DUF2321 domain-containing protein [Clostridium beijerinckii]